MTEAFTDALLGCSCHMGGLYQYTTEVLTLLWCCEVAFCFSSEVLVEHT